MTATAERLLHSFTGTVAEAYVLGVLHEGWCTRSVIDYHRLKERILLMGPAEVVFPELQAAAARLWERRVIPIEGDPERPDTWKFRRP